MYMCLFLNIHIYVIVTVSGHTVLYRKYSTLRHFVQNAINLIKILPYYTSTFVYRIMNMTSLKCNNNIINNTSDTVVKDTHQDVCKLKLNNMID